MRTVLQSLISQKEEKKLLVGLGNPETKYLNTWHNIGQLYIDYCKDWLQTNHQAEYTQQKLKGETISEFRSLNLLLLKPTEYMNKSGVSVNTVSQFLKLLPQNIIVAYDDLDLEIGTYKLQFGKYPKVHNGVNSVIAHLHTGDFYHLRIGIRQYAEANSLKGVDYVLSQIPEEKKLQIREVFSQICSEIFA